jgi:pimeloyl-ACP methyl ester carboxylesterase
MFVRRTKEIRSSHESIAKLEEIKLGGHNQYVLMRGANVNHPILLFLHGGPGTAQIGFAPKFQRELEREFLVVNWDQRGSGLSYSEQLKKEDVTIESILSDTVELIEYLLKRFKQPKLFLCGHSWGSVLGVLTAQRVPHLIYAYIGIGQVAKMRDGERISYEYTLRKAKESNHAKALKELEGTPYDPLDMKYLMLQRKWLTKFGGSYVGINMFKLIYSKMLTSTEYKLKDWFSYVKAARFSIEAIWPELLEIDFLRSAAKLEVPVYIFAGRHDYQTPFELAQRYFEALECPYKELVWFENSAHMVKYEEPEKFDRECLRIKQKTVY